MADKEQKVLVFKHYKSLMPESIKKKTEKRRKIRN